MPSISLTHQVCVFARSSLLPTEPDLQDMSTSPLRLSGRFGFWTVLFWFFVQLQEFKYAFIMHFVKSKLMKGHVESNDHSRQTDATIQRSTYIFHQQDGQARRGYNPFLNLAYISPRPGANPWRIVNQIRSKLRMSAAAVQVPIGVEDEFKGVVDLVNWKAIYNEGVKG